MDAMTIFIIIVGSLIVICVIGLAFCVYMLHRNKWVYNIRSELLREKPAEYDKLLDYTPMLNKFWVWDIEKLKRK